MQAPSTSSRFGKLLRGLRQTLGLTQLELAGNAGISNRHLSFLETARAHPSNAMVSKLATALDLDSRTTDELRAAAGFCPRGESRSDVAIGAQIFETALMMDASQTVAQLIESARFGLRVFGVEQFFFGALHGDDRQAEFDWATLGAFPDVWLQRYDRERYAMTDPLLAIVRQGGNAFFWDDVMDRAALAKPARDMFDRLSGSGIHCGFVASRRSKGSTQIVSMMGSKLDQSNRATRLGLDIVAARLLAGLDQLGALPNRRGN